MRESSLPEQSAPVAGLFARASININNYTNNNNIYPDTVSLAGPHRIWPESMRWQSFAR